MLFVRSTKPRVTSIRVDVTATKVVAARALSVPALCTVWLLQCAVTTAAFVGQSTAHEIEQKPLLPWSAEEVTKLLTDSPWISYSVYAATGQTQFVVHIIGASGY
jgi:hypothetical protein